MMGTDSYVVVFFPLTLRKSLFAMLQINRHPCTSRNADSKSPIIIAYILHRALVLPVGVLAVSIGDEGKIGNFLRLVDGRHDIRRRKKTSSAQPADGHRFANCQTRNGALGASSTLLQHPLGALLLKFIAVGNVAADCTLAAL